ncbi:MAG: glutamine synthetase family protein [Betaproteobacteria bacterium]|jgi:glutamine synthetase|nr:glutamine synthetase family protein [Betaproteobacteria bacterium]
MTAAPSFVERHGLWSDTQRAAARHALQEISARGIELVRFSFADQHGLLRGKTIAAAALPDALASGVAVVSTLFAKDTSHKTVYPVFSAGGGFGMAEMEGGGDAIIVADPTTFRVLPWAPDTAWLLCDAYFPGGKPVPFDTRHVCRMALDRLAGAGYEFLAGLEIEFHVFRITDPHLRHSDAGQPGEPPEVSLLSTGYQLLSESRYDQIDPVMEILRRDLAQLELPLRSFEIEYGPSQLEITLSALPGLGSADAMVLFRSAVKQICRRHGYHATFMCRPRLPNVMSSGWHLHQSLALRGTGANAFMPETAGEQLSRVGRQYLAGLLEHARGASAFATPTINGYKRYRPFALAPDRATWGRDNRGTMLRVLGGADDPATRIENRLGESAANPYLYFASQIYAGLDGIVRGLDPGAAADTPYDARAPMLPRTLEEAIACLREDAAMRAGFGDGFVDYFCRIKEAEIARFNLEVTDWEHREYFDMF